MSKKCIYCSNLFYTYMVFGSVANSFRCTFLRGIECFLLWKNIANFAEATREKRFTTITPLGMSRDVTCHRLWRHNCFSNSIQFEVIYFIIIWTSQNLLTLCIRKRNKLFDHPSYVLLGQINLAKGGRPKELFNIIMILKSWDKQPRGNSADSNQTVPEGAVLSGSTVFEPRHDKTNKVSVRPAKTQISLGICTRFLDADSEDSDQTGHTLILLVLSCGGSFAILLAPFWHTPRYLHHIVQILEYCFVIFTVWKAPTQIPRSRLWDYPVLYIVIIMSSSQRTISKWLPEASFQLLLKWLSDCINWK